MVLHAAVPKLIRNSNVIAKTKANLPTELTSAGSRLVIDHHLSTDIYIIVCIVEAPSNSTDSIVELARGDSVVIASEKPFSSQYNVQTMGEFQFTIDHGSNIFVQQGL